jgi:hypothetical protein
MNWKGCERKQPWGNLMYYPGMNLEELSETTENLSCQKVYWLRFDWFVIAVSMYLNFVLSNVPRI